MANPTLRAILIFAGLTVFASSAASQPPTRQDRAFRDCIGCPEMEVVPAGAFIMGSPDSEPLRYKDESPQRRVTFASGFAVGRFEVTRGEYAAFSAATGRPANEGCYTDRALRGTLANDARANWRDPGFAQTDAHPVVCVSWDDAVAYAEWLGARTGRRYRLLTEAEWEYAARAGTTTAWIWGTNADEGCAHVNGADQTARLVYPGWRTLNCSDGALYTAAVGGYAANRFDLHDMVGNVWEWTQDCWAPSYEGAPTDGSASLVGACIEHSIRGGSWYLDGPKQLRSANRSGAKPPTRFADVGFRVARDL